MDYAIATFLGTLGRLRAELLAPIDILAAILVTGHVLLNKRETASATAWIGLAWLSPIAGGILYAMFGVNRVRRRARRLVDRRLGGARHGRADSRNWDGHLASLERAGSRITGREMTEGNDFTVLDGGDHAYPLMIEAIEGAQRTVALSSYIFRNDRAGRRFIAALGDAVRRGVRVRVLIDGVGSGYLFSGTARALRRAGVPTGRFMHSFLPWRMPFLNLRTHKKVLVVDGVRGFTGGMNIADGNVLASQPRHPVRDTHFALSGPVVAQLSDAFMRDWTFTTAEELDAAEWIPPNTGGGRAHARVATSGPDSDIEKIEFLMLQAVSTARERVAIVTPYFLPEDRLLTALGLAAERGVAVDIVIPERSNHRFVDWATRAHVGPLLAEGVRIWFNPPPFDHTKLMMVDRLWSTIGSANWDMRSLRLNFELNVEVYDEALARRIDAMIEARKGRPLTSRDLDERRLPVRLLDASMRLLLPYL